MSGSTRIQVALAMEETGLVPLFYHHDEEICREVIKACHDRRRRVFEFTNRGDFAHEVFAEVKKWAAENCPGMMMGQARCLMPPQQPSSCRWAPTSLSLPS